jgi:uncharacterized protein (DUF1697 family)
VSGTHVALLRGINVGKAKRVAMADLRALVAELGYREPRTLLNSGNVVFTAPRTTARKAASTLEAGIASRLGVQCRVFALTARELREVIEGNPLIDVATDPARLLVAVGEGATFVSQLAPLAREDWGAERFAVGARAAYLWCANGILESPLAQAFGRAARDGATTRNWTTIRKLDAMMGASGA